MSAGTASDNTALRMLAYLTIPDDVRASLSAESRMELIDVPDALDRLRLVDVLRTAGLIATIMGHNTTTPAGLEHLARHAVSP